MPTAADVPGKFDVVINGQGYIFRKVRDFIRAPVERAQMGYTPTFVERSNTSGDYGDQQQDFWLTTSQHDWSLGEGQAYYVNGDADSVRRYWRGGVANTSASPLATNLPGGVDIEKPGQATVRPAHKEISLPANAIGCCAAENGFSLYITSATNLYRTDPMGTLTTIGAHGVTAHQPFALAQDGTNLFIGGNSIRKWNGSTFSAFYANSAYALAFVMNTLFAITYPTSGAVTLYRLSSAGVATSLFPWKAADGTASNRVPLRMIPFGGKLLILFRTHMSGELWQYDGSGTTMMTTLPGKFQPWDMTVAGGVIYISGQILKPASATTAYKKPAVYYYSGGSLGQAWEAEDYLPTAVDPSTNLGPGIGQWEAGVAWMDPYRNYVVYYNGITGATSSLALLPTNSANGTTFAGNPAHFLVMINGHNYAYLFPLPATTAYSTVVETSLFDFSSSLKKRFRGVTIDAEIPTGATIDLFYKLDSHSAAWQAIATNITPGIEYPLGAIGHSVALCIVLNKGTSASGPTLKRLYVRAAPILNRYRRGSYNLNLANNMILNDGSTHTKTGLQMAQDLFTAVNTDLPFSITDHLGTYTGVAEADQFELDLIRATDYQPDPTQPLDHSKPEFIAQVGARGV